MSRDLHMVAYYLHPAYHYTHELAYEDDLATVFTRVVKRLSRSPVQAADAIDEAKDPMVAWVARATTERGEYELDEEADDPEDPPRPNTFLARAVAEATAEEEGDRGNVGQPYSPHYEMDPEAEVDLLGEIELEHVERTIGGRHGHDDDDDFERLMEGVPRTQSLREAPSQSIRRGSSTQVVLLQMLEVAVAVVVTVEVEVEVVTVVREEEVVRWHSQRSNFSGVQHKILVMVLHCSIIEGKSLVVAVMQEVLQWIPIAMRL
ncbi:hypothetical protein Taro_008775 [Colocasia esculenta]|uniref:Uncharacterized protein n=1 Tax=Colocasia esculenta TaxID=4460 RepID=A0A843U233_COLES|nr:hypothetical protein [Colocasia esculenta]